MRETNNNKLRERMVVEDEDEEKEEVEKEQREKVEGGYGMC